MKTAHLLAFAALVVSAPTFAADKDKDDKDKLICKTEKVTGSRTRTTRTCMTRSQWDEFYSQTKKGVDELNSSSAGGTNSSFNPNSSPGAGGPLSVN